MAATESLPTYTPDGQTSPRSRDLRICCTECGYWHLKSEPCVDVDWRRDLATALEAGGDQTAADRCLMCHREGAGWYNHCDHHPDHDAHYWPFSCMLRVCPDCARYLSRLIQDRYRGVLEYFDLMSSRDRGLIHLVLTRSVDLLAGLSDLPAYLVHPSGYPNAAFYAGDDLHSEIDSTLQAARQLLTICYGLGSDPEVGALACVEFGSRGNKLHVHIVLYGSFCWKSRDLEAIYAIEAVDPKLYARVIESRAKGRQSRDFSLYRRLLRVVHWRLQRAGVQLSGGPYVDQVWQGLTGDRVTYVRFVTHEEAVAEILKYAIKFPQGSRQVNGRREAVTLPAAAYARLHFALKGSRRVRSWGSFYNFERRLFRLAALKLLIAGRADLAAVVLAHLQNLTDPPARVEFCSQCYRRLVWSSEIEFESWRSRCAEARAIFDLRLANKSLARAPPEQLSEQLQLPLAVM